MKKMLVIGLLALVAVWMLSVVTVGKVSLEVFGCRYGWFVVKVITLGNSSSCVRQVDPLPILTDAPPTPRPQDSHTTSVCQSVIRHDPPPPSPPTLPYPPGGTDRGLAVE
jgi:hypothetical protein